MLVATNEGELEAEFTRLRQFINTAEIAPSLHPNRDGRATIRIIEFYLDGPGFPVWRPVADAHSGLMFNFPPAPPLALGQ
jgi:hypothetical protein